MENKIKNAEISRMFCCRRSLEIAIIAAIVHEIKIYLHLMTLIAHNIFIPLFFAMEKPVEGLPQKQTTHAGQNSPASRRHVFFRRTFSSRGYTWLPEQNKEPTQYGAVTDTAAKERERRGKKESRSWIPRRSRKWRTAAQRAAEEKRSTALSLISRILTTNRVRIDIIACALINTQNLLFFRS